MTRNRVISLLLFFIFTFPIFSQNLKEMKREIDIFSQILNTSMKESISHPLLISDSPKGAYVRGYGVIFHSTLNLNRASILSFSSRKGTKSINNRSDLNKLLSNLKKNIVDTISQYGNGFKLLPSDEKICIIIHVLNRNFLEGKNLDRVLIISVKKKYITSLLTKNITMENFKKRIRYIEY